MGSAFNSASNPPMPQKRVSFKDYSGNKWTPNIAVGDKSFLEQIKDQLKIRANGRKINEGDDEYQLPEGQTIYGDWH
jgi:hypothetical protein